MPRLLSPDDWCMGVDVGSRRYDGTVIDVTDPAHARALKQVGYVQADISGGPARGGGFECWECGFRSYFKSCSRCGATRG